MRDAGLDARRVALLLAGSPDLQELWLGQNPVGGAAAICVRNCKQLRKLGLDRAGILDSHAVELAKLLEGDCGLQELHLGQSPFGGNDVGLKGAEALGKMLARNQTLLVLRLDNNPLKDTGIRALWAGLGSNATLQILGLDGTGWTDEGVQVSIAGLQAQAEKRGPKLQELHCGGNAIEERGLGMLMDLLDSDVPRIESIAAWKAGKKGGISKQLLDRVAASEGRVVL
jgi:hypothetical protein